MMRVRFLRFLPVASLILAAHIGAAASPPVRILTSFYPIYVMALNVAGGTPGVSVECLSGPSAGCLHDYQLTPGDMRKLSGADIFITNGAGMESFIGKVLKQSPSLKVVEAGKGIPLAFGDNPHIWVGISGAIGETKNIADGLSEIDPARAREYRRNAAAYVAKLEDLRKEMHAALDGFKSRSIVTFHEAFPYFAQEFGLDIAGVVEREPGSEPNARELAAAIETVKRSKVRALFAEPQYSAKSAEVIARETGIPVSILDPAVTGPADPAMARDSYLAAMRKNLAVLREALADR